MRDKLSAAAGHGSRKTREGQTAAGAHRQPGSFQCGSALPSAALLRFRTMHHVRKRAPTCQLLLPGPVALDAEAVAGGSGGVGPKVVGHGNAALLNCKDWVRSRSAPRNVIGGLRVRDLLMQPVGKMPAGVCESAPGARRPRRACLRRLRGTGSQRTRCFAGLSFQSALGSTRPGRATLRPAHARPGARRGPVRIQYTYNGSQSLLLACKVAVIAERRRGLSKSAVLARSGTERSLFDARALKNGTGPSIHRIGR